MEFNIALSHTVQPVSMDSQSGQRQVVDKTAAEEIALTLSFIRLCDQIPLLVAP